MKIYKIRQFILYLMLLIIFPSDIYAQTSPLSSSSKNGESIGKCDQSFKLSTASKGRVRLHEYNGMAWLSLYHNVTSGDSHGLKFRNRQTPFLELDIRIDADGTIGILNGWTYLTETWSVSQNIYVSDWLQNFSFGDLELSNAPINMLMMSEYGDFKNHKTRLGIGANADPEEIYKKLKSGATFKSKAVNKSAPSEFIEIEIDMSDVPGGLVKLHEMLATLKEKAASGQCIPL